MNHRVYLMGLLSLSFFTFQNCGEFRAQADSIQSSQAGVPQFFYDLQPVEISIDAANRKHFILDFVVSLARDPDLPVSYKFQFSTLLITGVCRSAEGVASGAGKHFHIDCLMPTQEDMYVQLMLVGPDEETFVDQFRF